MAWADDRYATIGATPRFFGSLLGPSGEALLPASVPLQIGATSLASDGTIFLATHGDAGVSSRILATDGREMDAPAGIPLASVPFSSCTNQASSACLGGTCLVAVTCYVPQFGFPTKEQVIVQRVRASDGTPLDGAGIHVTATQESGNRLPVVGAGAASFLVVWQNYITGISSVTEAARVDPAGNVGSSFTVGLGEDPKAVASNGSDFFVLLDGREVWGTRVRENDLALLDGLPGQGAIPIAAGTAGLSMGATYDGQSYVVAFGDTRSGTAGLYASRIRPSDGVLLDGTASNSGFLVRADSVDGVSISSAGHGRSLIVSSSPRGAPYGAARVSGQFIDESDAGIEAGGGGVDAAIAAEGGEPGDAPGGDDRGAATNALADAAGTDDGSLDGDANEAAPDASAAQSDRSDATTDGAPGDAAAGYGSANGAGGCQAGSLRPAANAGLLATAILFLAGLRRRKRARPAAT